MPRGLFTFLAILSICAGFSPLAIARDDHDSSVPTRAYDDLQTRIDTLAASIASDQDSDNADLIHALSLKGSSPSAIHHIFLKKLDRALRSSGRGMDTIPTHTDPTPISMAPWLKALIEENRAAADSAKKTPKLYVYYDSRLNNKPHPWSTQAAILGEHFPGETETKGLNSIDDLIEELTANSQKDELQIVIVLSHAEAGEIAFQDGSLGSEKDKNDSSSLPTFFPKNKPKPWSNVPMNNVCAFGVFGCSFFSNEEAQQRTLRTIQQQLAPGQTVRIVGHEAPSNVYDDLPDGDNPLLSVSLVGGSEHIADPVCVDRCVGFALPDYNQEEHGRLTEAWGSGYKTRKHITSKIRPVLASHHSDVLRSWVAARRPTTMVIQHYDSSQQKKKIKMLMNQFNKNKSKNIFKPMPFSKFDKSFGHH